MNFRKVAVLVGLGTLGGVLPASAIVILPGGDTPLSGTSVGSRPELAGSEILSTSSAFTGKDAGNNVLFSGTLELKIIRETVAGTLDFYYRLSNDSGSADAIHRFTNIDFGGYSTDVDFRTDLAGGTVPAAYADRSANGSIVGFDFTLGGGGLLTPGSTSKWFFIKTDATNYHAGSTAVINGGVATVASYAPAAPVPEPMTMALAGMALAAAARRRRR